MREGDWPGSSEATTIHGDPLLPPRDPRRETPYVAINMVATVDGRVRLPGRGSTLGSRADRRLMRRLRAEADAVLHGAATLRSERFAPRVPADLADQRQARGQPRQPTGVVVSASGRLPLDHPYVTSAAPSWPRLVYTCADVGWPPLPGVEVVRAAGTEMDLGWMLRDLAARGIQRVVCEGGPRLNGQLIAEGLVDELFLTVAPLLAGGDDALTIVAGTLEPTRRLVLRSVSRVRDELFLRYALR